VCISYFSCVSCHHSIYFHFLALRMFTEHYKLRKTFEFFPSSCHFPIRRSTQAPQYHVHKLYQLFYHRLRHRLISTIKFISLFRLCTRHSDGGGAFKSKSRTAAKPGWGLPDCSAFKISYSHQWTRPAAEGR